tara:strand:- start:320 stop:700 length:381 start_codon:yes stop_codon:yes gene_type:complete
MKDLQDILKLVIDETGVDVTSRKRDHKTVINRWIYFKMASEFTNNSLHKIGAAINKNHATVIHGLKQFEFETQWDKDLQTQYERIAIIYMQDTKCNDLKKINSRIEFMHNELSKLEAIKNELINAK